MLFFLKRPLTQLSKLQVPQNPDLLWSQASQMFCLESHSPELMLFAWNKSQQIGLFTKSY